MNQSMTWQSDATGFRSVCVSACSHRTLLNIVLFLSLFFSLSHSFSLSLTLSLFLTLSRSFSSSLSHSFSLSHTLILSLSHSLILYLPHSLILTLSFSFFLWLFLTYCWFLTIYPRLLVPTFSVTLSLSLCPFKQSLFLPLFHSYWLFLSFAHSLYIILH